MADEVSALLLAGILEYLCLHLLVLLLVFRLQRVIPLANNIAYGIESHRMTNKLNSIPDTSFQTYIVAMNNRHCARLTPMSPIVETTFDEGRDGVWC